MSVVVGATSGQSSGEIKASLRVSVDSASKARFMTHRKESISTHQLGCPLKEGDRRDDAPSPPLAPPPAARLRVIGGDGDAIMVASFILV
ncbi:hypothetical protein LINPERPRIM_LOCUS25572 [Linum perenne]